jgi:hypothetical protein
MQQAESGPFPVHPQSRTEHDGHAVTSDNGPVTESVPEDAALRLRRRYPRSRIPRPITVVLVAVGAAVALGWLIWAALVHSTPTVTAQVTAYEVKSDREIAVTLTVDRPDPTRAATCRVTAQAVDFQVVGERQVVIPPAPYQLTDVGFSLTTLRRATTASAKGCTSDG